MNYDLNFILEIFLFGNSNMKRQVSYFQARSDLKKSNKAVYVYMSIVKKTLLFFSGDFIIC